MRYIFKSILVLFIGVLSNKTSAQVTMNFDLKAVPFSYYGSYLTLSSRTDPAIQNIPGLFIHNVSGKYAWNWDGIFRIDALQNGKIIDYEIAATPSKVTLSKGNATCEICFEDRNTLRFKTHEMDIRLTCFQKGFFYHFPIAKGEWLIPDFVLSSIRGDAEKKVNDQNYQTYLFSTNGSETCEFAVELYESGWKPRVHKPFEECVKDVEKEIMRWVSKYPPGEKKYQDALNLALYLNWSSVVAPRDNMTQYGMLMSKNVMCNIWSWDNCFDAIATAYAFPELAWAQVQVMFDHQNKEGAIPDNLNDLQNKWAFTKPPVYGIMIENLMQKKIIDEKQFPYIYDHVAKLTDFWFNYRDLNRNGIPEYFHGNDSGWDNCTMYDVGFPNESADLCAFLVTQMDFLSDIALKIGKSEEAKTWKARSDKVLNLMLSDLWKENHFISRNITNGKWNEKSKCLLPYIPLILGERLPKEFRDKLVKGLKESGNLTQFGLASENPESPFYKADGYWRGPIWAPSTWLIVKGLIKCGETEYAKDIARRYCDMCIKSGFPENFNALTGEPLRDLAYTWTSSVFIDFLYEYINTSHY